MMVAALNGRTIGRVSTSADRIADRAPAHGQPASVEAAPPSLSNQEVQTVLAHSPGRPLEKSSRAFFEPRMGRDFSDVRIHAGREASRAALALGADAFTIGRDIVFGEDQYAPESRAGRQLLAHELTHTVQQADTGTAQIQRKPSAFGRFLYSAGEYLSMVVTGLDIGAIAAAEGLPALAVGESTSYAAAGHDYGPQNALRHCILAGLLDSWGWKAALAEMGLGTYFGLAGGLAGSAGMAGAGALLVAYGALMAARVRLFLKSHEWFGDDGCGNYGTGTIDSKCDWHNNEVGLALGSPFKANATIISEAKDALDTGALWMAPGPKSLSTTVSTASWRTSPWMTGGPQQADCAAVTVK